MFECVLLLLLDSVLEVADDLRTRDVDRKGVAFALNPTTEGKLTIRYRLRSCG
jgi:hypothetical protein